MPMQIVTRVIQSLLTKSITRPSKTALILGATFKEDCPDVRNSKVKDIYTSLLKYNIVTKIYDPVANIAELKGLYSDAVISNLKEDFKFDIIIIAVSHTKFLNLDIEKLSHTESVIFDVKALFPKSKGYLRL